MTVEVLHGPPWPDGGAVIDLDRLGSLTVGDLAALEARGSVSVAAVAGRCEGAALAVSMAADLVVAGPDATFGRAGAWADVVVRRGRGIVGRKAVAYLTMTDRSVGADTALRWGLVCEIADDPVRAARDIAEAVGARSPVAVRVILRQAHRGAARDYADTVLTGPARPDRT